MKYSDCVAIYFSLIGSEYLWLQHVECVHWRVECRISSFVELRYYVYLYIKTFFPLLIIFNQNFPALLIFGYSKKKIKFQFPKISCFYLYLLTFNLILYQLFSSDDVFTTSFKHSSGTWLPDISHVFIILHTWYVVVMIASLYKY